MDHRLIVVAGACLTQFTVIGLLFSYGLFFKVFEAEYGWSRTLLSACSSLSFFMMGVLAMAGGALNDRFGPRIVLSVTGVTYGVGFALLSQVSEPWHLFAIFGVFIAIGLSTHDVVTLSTIARWFERKRGIMTAVVKIGTAVGQMVIPPLAALAFVAFGWREAVVVIGVAAGVLLLAAATMMRMPPEAASDTPEIGRKPRKGIEFGEAAGMRIFWTLCAIQFLFFPTLTTVPLHIVVHGMDHGMSAPLAAVLLTVIGGTSVLGRLAVGTLTDRIGGRNAYALCFVPLIASLCALLLAGEAWMLFAILAVYGFAHGGFFTVVSPTVAEFFGLRAHGAIFGVVLFFGTVGGAVGPILAGRVFDETGSYFIAFATLAGMVTLGLVLLMTLPARAVRVP